VHLDDGNGDISTVTSLGVAENESPLPSLPEHITLFT